MQATPQTVNPPRLSYCAVLAAVSVVVALIFGSVFHTAPHRAFDREHDDHHGHHGHAHPHKPDQHDHTTHQPPAAPAHYAGGIWSPKLGLTPLNEIAALLVAQGNPIEAASLRWHDNKLVTLDTTPPIAIGREGKSVAFIAVDYSAGNAPEDLPLAIEAYVESLTNAERFVTFTPLPGPDFWPDPDDRDDWTYLWLGEEEDYADWPEIKPKKDLPDLPGLPYSGQLRSWLALAVPDHAALNDTPTAELITALDNKQDPKRAAQALWSLAMRSPYEVIPALDAWLKQAPEDQRSARLHTALLLRRALNVHADELIAQAAESKDPALRLHAARAIGDLADQTTDPLGKLTKLAEDRSMAVRQEAMLACLKVPGRRAAGIAQLVEAYERDGAMLLAYADTMDTLLAYGEPIEADSRVNRLRRMPYDELFAQARDALVARVLLERPELPNDQIVPLIAPIAEQAKLEPLPAYINLLTTMSASTLNKRKPLLDTLANWGPAELKANADTLTKAAKSNAPQALRAAAAGALIRSTDFGTAAQRLGTTPLLFEGVAWMTDDASRKAASPAVLAAALGEGVDTQTQSAALDAIQHLPADSVAPKSVQAVLALARTADSDDVRFAAIRAINSMPASIQPPDIDDLKLTTFTVRAVIGGVMKYDITKLTAVAGRPVELTLINPDSMEHNLVITKPKAGQAIGAKGGALPASTNHVPDSEDVLHFIPILRPGQSYTLRFFAPKKPGDYDYVCTIPGHSATMNGILEIVSP